MRRIRILFLCAITVLCLCISANAATEISKMSIHAVVSSDGSSQFTTTVSLHLDESVDSLLFPLPKEAVNISLNGSKTRTHASETALYIDLTKVLGNFTGDFSFALSYNLPNMVTTTDTEALQLRLPLMSGFAYPTELLEFSVALPGEFSAKPGFSSGYHQANIEQFLSYEINSATITGQSKTALKDHETLLMILPVSETLFPQTTDEVINYTEALIALAVCAALALIYWILFLRGLPVWSKPQTTPPEGYNAGQLRSILYLQGTDLTMMVFSWAQLGYVMIQPNRRGHVYLHKQMEMGNERSSFERRCFNSLFGKRNMVDACGTHYAAQYAKVSKMEPNIQSFMRRHSGNLKVFRVLCGLIGLCCGGILGSALSVGAASQLPFVILFALLGFAATYAMTLWAVSIFQLEKSRLWLTLVLAVVWIVFSLIAGQPLAGFSGAAAGFLGGLLLAIGGRRTEAGKQATMQVVGLQRYFLRVSRQELQRICQTNPEYFFDLAPYALALGTDLLFAQRFGKNHLPPCPYIYTGKDEDMTAAKWALKMRRIVNTMSAHKKNTFLGRVIPHSARPRR